MRTPSISSIARECTILAGLALAMAAEAKPPTQATTLPLPYALERLADAAISGGVPKDGIPAIDRPRFETAAQANDFLRPDDVVFGVVINGEARAYPRRVLVWHEIVNDVVGGESLSVTYCPLTGTAIGFKRGDTTFGVSGSLVNSNLIMYDRATGSHWPQMLGAAISGPLNGQSLQTFPVVWTSWRQWQAHYPDTRVLSRRTGYARNYHRDPYGSGYNPPTGYYAQGGPTFPTLSSDRRLEPKEIVTGARTAEGAAAFRKSTLRVAGVANKTLNGTTLTAFHDPALDTVHVYRNPEQREFSARDGRYSDKHGTWRAGQMPLEPVHAYDAMWFAWAAFFPKTALHE